MPKNPKVSTYQQVWELKPEGSSPGKTWTVVDHHGDPVSTGMPKANTRVKALQDAAELASRLQPPHRISSVIDTGITGSNGEYYLILDPR